MKNFLKFGVIIIALSTFTACTNYGKKVTFDGTQGEVYYKGEGVNEADAKKLGDYLKTVDYINNTKQSSFQLTKNGDAYILKMVINHAVYDTIKGIDESYKALGALISKNVFDNKKVDIALTDDYFVPFKTIQYDAAYVKSMDGDDGFGKDVPIDGTKGEVYIKGDGISETLAQNLGQHLRKINFLTD